MLAVLLTVVIVACDTGEFEAGPLGAVEVGPGESIHVRSMTSLTGVASLGVPERRGFEMAIADYGDIHGRAVFARSRAGLAVLLGRRTPRRRDRGGRPAGPPERWARRARSPEAQPRRSSARPASSWSRHQTPRPSLTSDLAGNAGSNQRAGYYRLSNNDLHQAGAVARFAYEELGLRSVGAIHDGDPYSEGLVSAFRGRVRRAGRSDRDCVPSKRARRTWAQSCLSSLPRSPDGLFFPLFPAEGAHVIGQVAGVAGLEGATLIGGAALLEPDTLALPESEGMYLPGPEQDFGDQVNEATGKSGAQLDRRLPRDVRRGAFDGLPRPRLRRHHRPAARNRGCGGRRPGIRSSSTARA